MNLSAWAYRYRPIVLTAVVLLMLFGSVSFMTMPRREDPEFTIRECVVTTTWPGAPAEKVEELVTDKIEDALVSIEEVDQVRSTTITGQSSIFVELGDEVPVGDIQNVWDKVRAKVDLVKMPDSSIRPVVNDEFGDTAILVLALYQVPLEGNDEVRKGDEYTARQLEEYADTVRDALRVLPGVAKVDKFGAQEERIYIGAELGSWSQLQLTTNELKQLVSDRNIIESGGNINTPSGRYAVFPGGELDAVEEIESIIVDRAESGESQNHVYLEDIGLDVVRSYEDPPRRICRYGDTTTSADCVVLALTMKSGSNIIDICDRAKKRLHDLIEYEQALPPDIAVTPVSDQSENVAGKIEDVISNVVAAIIIVIIVVLIVVGFRISIVMAANIPVVVLAAIGVITLFGVQLEQISLASIIIALGLLVDNAVQVCDQARSNQKAGMKPVEAAVKGARTLATPMLMGTLTTVAAFVPMLIALKGGGREYVYSLPVTLSTTLALSWLLAMTLCVILAAWFIRVPADEESQPTFLESIGKQLRNLLNRKATDQAKDKSSDRDESGSQNAILATYGAIAHLAIRWKWLTLAASFALFVLAVGLPVSTEFFPQDRRDQFAIQVWLPESSTIEQASEKARQVEEIVRRLSAPNQGDDDTREKLRAMRTIVGGGGSRWHLGWGPEAGKPNYAEILVRTSDGKFTEEYVREVRRIAEKGDEELGLAPVVGARVVPREMPLGPPADPVVIRVNGSGFADLAEMKRIANEVKGLVEAEPGTWNVTDSWGVSSFQLDVDINEERANLAGVTNSQVAQSLNAYFAGLELTTFNEGDHQIPVYFRVTQANRDSIRHVENAYIEGGAGKIPLRAIANFERRWTPAKIERRDQNRSIEVSSRVEDGIQGNDVVNAIMNSDKMADLKDRLPYGFSIEVGGALAESQESSGQMMLSFGISFVSIIVLLVIQYNGWAKPIVILTTLPMALIGAIPGLYFTGNPIGFMPQLGVLSLFGIVLNTGIIYIEFADILIAERIRNKKVLDGPILGLTRQEFRECLVDAGKQRMLPIFLTTATTIGGLLPLALDGGPLWEGLAWCMIFGLIVATFLTLFVVPTLYSIFVEVFRVRPVSTGDQAPADPV